MTTMTPPRASAKRMRRMLPEHASALAQTPPPLARRRAITTPRSLLRRSALRARDADDVVHATLSSPPPPPGMTTPARPPRMPRFDRERAAGPTDRKIVHRINALSATELMDLVKDVELRYRQLAAFEAEEIRRAQLLGFTIGQSCSVMQTAW